ncbi:hypothetical protein Hanom_Chr14g01255041 [Helianthus anomalus]
MTTSCILVFCFVSPTDIKDPMTRSGEQVKVGLTKLRVTTVVDTKVELLLLLTMVCGTLSVSSQLTTPKTENRKPKTRTQTNILNRPISGQNLRQHARLQRAYLDHNMCYSANNVQTSMNQPKLKNSRSIGVFNLKPSSSIVDYNI